MCVQIEGMLSIYRDAKEDHAPENVDLGALALSVFDGLRSVEPWRSVDYIIAPDLHAFGYPSMLRVVLENLLGNAWKFSALEPVAKIEFGGFEDEDGSKTFYLRDNGAGFQMEGADKLFDVFSRFHREDEFAGTGIGLASVKRIVNKHGGRVWAESEVGKGATFYFTLPAVPVLIGLDEIFNEGAPLDNLDAYSVAGSLK